MELRITSPDGTPVDGLDIDVVPWMPTMGHGSSIRPATEAKGGGRYVVSNVALFMSARWDLRTIISGAVSDRALITVQIQ
ncbi:Hypothetical protein A7982_00077 [Minicystis rosea]|nr:Hypothetical protein A7982_00077 [Minicystis rosea]